jgi:hypothetical protein
MRFSFAPNNLDVFDGGTGRSLTEGSFRLIAHLLTHPPPCSIPIKRCTTLFCRQDSLGVQGFPWSWCSAL